MLFRSKEIVKRREELYLGLQKIAGIKPFSSQANFIFFSCAFDSDRIYKKLVAEGIVVKNLNIPPLMPDCMRVTVGNRKGNDSLLRVLKSIVPG